MPAPVEAAVGPVKRRSYRFAHRVPVVLTNRNSSSEFREPCETIEVSAHGCQVRSPRKLAPGQAVQLLISHPQREIEARVATVQADASASAWEIGLELAQPGNCWGLKFSPQTCQWPADLPLPPVAAPAVERGANEATPAAGKEPASAVAHVPPPELQEQRLKEFEARIEETLRQATNQLSKNAQFALETVDGSVRELTESSRKELEEWMAVQRAELDQQLLRFAEASRRVATEDVIERLREQTRRALSEEVENFRLRLREAIEAGLASAADHLLKGKQS